MCSVEKELAERFAEVERAPQPVLHHSRFIPDGLSPNLFTAVIKQVFQGNAGLLIVRVGKLMQTYVAN